MALEPALLLEATSATNREELDLFIRRVQGKISGYIAKRVRNRDHAEEIVSRVYEAIARSWSSFRGDCPPEAYAMTVASNALKNYYARDLQRHSAQISLSDWLETFSLQHETESMCPQDRLESVELVQGLLAEMDRCCTQVESGVVALYYQGETFDGISCLLGMNGATARSHFLRGRQKLLAHLLVEAPSFLGGLEEFMGTVDRIESQEPNLLSVEEVHALRSRSGPACILRGAMIKVAPFLNAFN